MTSQNKYKQILGYMLIQRVVVFLALYEYLNRLFQNSNAHAVIQAGANTYQYDANGNMTQRPNQTITYDYDNRPTSINSTTFIYDYSGQRVKKNNTIYIGKLYECTNGNCTKYIFAGSSRIASKTSSNTYYYHTDHLGSSSIITDAAGNKVEEIYYYPFGGTRLNQGSVNLKHKYTGQEEDPETGLYYYNARYYDPILGRFISADSIVQDPFDPQAFNRYSYTRNNPLIYTDPTGNFFDTYYSYGGGGGCYWCNYDPWAGSYRRQQEAYWNSVASSSSSSSSSSTSTSSSSSTSTPTPAPTPASSTQVYNSPSYNTIYLPRTAEYFSEGVTSGVDRIVGNLTNMTLDAYNWTTDYLNTRDWKRTLDNFETGNNIAQAVSLSLTLTPSGVTNVVGAVGLGVTGVVGLGIDLAQSVFYDKPASHFIVNLVSTTVTFGASSVATRITGTAVKYSFAAKRFYTVNSTKMWSFVKTKIGMKGNRIKASFEGLGAVGTNLYQDYTE